MDDVVRRPDELSPEAVVALRLKLLELTHRFDQPPQATIDRARTYEAYVLEPLERAPKPKGRAAPPAA